jgi:RimJ/RimL family protein N-acetyltransferase
MSYQKMLVGSKCYLSPCTVEDAEKWTLWDNDLEVAVPLGDEAYTPTSLEKSREIIGDVISGQKHVFGIVDIETDELVGRCLLFDIDHVNRKAMLGITIGEKGYWGKGYGQDAVSLLLDYGFNLLNLNSVMLGTFSFNQRAIQCYKKVGFKEIGKRRQARIIAGTRYDIILMDMLAEAFRGTQITRFVEQGATDSASVV